MRRTKLTSDERAVEEALLRGEYQDVGKGEFEALAGPGREVSDADLRSAAPPGCVTRAAMDLVLGQILELFGEVEPAALFLLEEARELGEALADGGRPGIGAGDEVGFERVFLLPIGGLLRLGARDLARELSARRLALLAGLPPAPAAWPDAAPVAPPPPSLVSSSRSRSSRW
jgi:hypothetical protein